MFSSLFSSVRSFLFRWSWLQDAGELHIISRCTKIISEKRCNLREWDIINNYADRSSTFGYYSRYVSNSSTKVCFRNRILQKYIYSWGPEKFGFFLMLWIFDFRESNPDIHREIPKVNEYRSRKNLRNLIQAYSTSSHRPSYERSSTENGLYISHLGKFITKDIPVQKVFEEVGRCNLVLILRSYMNVTWFFRRFQ